MGTVAKKQVDRLENFLFLKEKKAITPLLKVKTKGNPKWGEKILKSGKAAAVLLAAGQAMRLGCEGPKGFFPILEKKSLFQLFFEKVFKAQKQWNCCLTIALMLEPKYYEEVHNFLKKHDFFGLNPQNVHLFSQSVYPMMNGRKQWFFQKGKLQLSPDGNGSFYESFVKSKVYTAFEKQGIEHVTILPIDNPLAEPFDPELIGFHCKEKNEVSLISILREDPQEKMGVLVKEASKISIIEYLDLQNLHFQPKFSNTNLFCFSMKFIKRVSQKKLKYHLIKKKKDQKIFYKYERFIFDSFSFANRIQALCYPREKCYAPLKTKRGKCGVKETREKLLNRGVL